MSKKPNSIIIEKNSYTALSLLLNEEFEPKTNIPARIQAIKADQNDYKPLDLPSGKTIPPPLTEIEKTNKVADNIIKGIDTVNSRLFNVYKDIISDVLKFIRDNDILYVTSTDDAFKKEIREQYDIDRFVEGAKALDKKITDQFGDLESPISKIVKDMKLDNSFQKANEYINVFKENLTKIYRDGLSDVFKLIAIGEGQ